MLGNTLSQNFLLDNQPPQSTRGLSRGAGVGRSASAPSGEFPVDLTGDLEDVENKTYNLYEKGSRLKSLYSSALGMGVDLTAPDFSDPNQRELAIMFQKGIADLQNESNSLKRSQEERKMIFEQNLKSPETGSTNLDNTRQTNISDFRDFRLTDETKTALTKHASSFDSQSERAENNQILDDLADSYRQRMLAPGVTDQQRANYQSQINALENRRATYNPSQDRNRAEQRAGAGAKLLDPKIWIDLQNSANTMDNDVFFPFADALGATMEWDVVDGVKKIKVDKDGRTSYIDMTDPDGAASSFRYLIGKAQGENKRHIQSAINDLKLNPINARAFVIQDWPLAQRQVSAIFSGEAKGDKNSLNIMGKNIPKRTDGKLDIVRGEAVQYFNEVAPTSDEALTLNGNPVTNIEYDDGEWTMSVMQQDPDSSGALKEDETNKEVFKKESVSGNELDLFLKENQNQFYDYYKERIEPYDLNVVDDSDLEYVKFGAKNAEALEDLRATAQDNGMELEPFIEWLKANDVETANEYLK